MPTVAGVVWTSPHPHLTPPHPHPAPTPPHVPPSYPAHLPPLAGVLVRRWSPAVEELDLYGQGLDDLPLLRHDVHQALRILGHLLRVLLCVEGFLALDHRVQPLIQGHVAGPYVSLYQLVVGVQPGVGDSPKKTN